MKPISKANLIAGLGVIAVLALTPTAFGSPDHGPHVTPTVRAATTPRATSHVHEAEHGNHTPTPFINHITGNAALTARLTPLLPSGMSLSDAASGFKDEGQFIAALHAAKDLNVSFVDLKAEMTGSPRDSLGQAIHDLKPAVDAKASAKTATSEARADIAATRPSLGARIAANTALVAKLTPLLPSGMSLSDAASGFKSEGQFIAALHAAKDLNVSFASLKSELLGSPRDSLGQAIHDLKPTIDAKAAATTAEQEAHTDIRSTRPPDADKDVDD
jgi:hypothetical protein